VSGARDRRREERKKEAAGLIEPVRQLDRGVFIGYKYAMNEASGLAEWMG
jgi:hypothetical protein